MSVKTQELLDSPRPQDHFVQLYTDDNALAQNVGRYLSEGFNEGDAGIVIATPEHREAFRSNLHSRKVHVDSLEQTRQLLFLDAARTLSRFMVNGRPEWSRFEATIFSAVESLARDGRRVRAYGEMVGLLWTSGEYSAAIKLEDHWNRILGSLGAVLYCSYPIDVFGKEFEATGVHAILCDHTHLLPRDEAEVLESALRRAIDAVAGSKVANFDQTAETSWPAKWGAVPSAERMILWVRQNLPNSAPEILSRARDEYRHHQRFAADDPNPATL